MKIRNLAIFLVLVVFSSCVNQDLARNLRYASNNQEIGVSNIAFKNLNNMKYGEACSYKFLIFPLIGGNSTIDAAADGNINNVRFVGETGFWGFPFSKRCTAVYGD